MDGAHRNRLAVDNYNCELCERGEVAAEFNNSLLRSYLWQHVQLLHGWKLKEVLEFRNAVESYLLYIR